jgi:hypothetical protein
MNPKLTAEQLDALKQSCGPVLVENEQTREVYFLVDKLTMDSLLQSADRAAIQNGIADLERGNVLTLDELDARIHSVINNLK